MRKVLFGIAALVAAGVVAVGALYYKGDLFRGGAAPAGQQSSWEPVPHPPGDRPKPEILLIREFGAWHLSCVRHRPPAGAMNAMPNFTSAPPPQISCHVFTMMRDTATREQTMIMSFRYRPGVAVPEVVVIYSVPGNADTLYEKTGQVVDLSKNKKMNLRGGFFLDPRRNKSAPSQAVPTIGVQLGHAKLKIQTQHCLKGHCFGHTTLPDTGVLDAKSTVVVGLPGPPHTAPRIINLPADRLGEALAQLKRLNAS